MNDRLEDDYSGDEAWGRFLNAAPDRLDRLDAADALIDAVGSDRRLAAAVHARVGRRALHWLDESQPSLEGLTLKDCLSSPDQRLVRRARGFLMEGC